MADEQRALVQPGAVDGRGCADRDHATEPVAGDAEPVADGERSRGRRLRPDRVAGEVVQAGGWRGQRAARRNRGGHTERFHADECRAQLPERLCDLDGDRRERPVRERVAGEVHGAPLGTPCAAGAQYETAAASVVVRLPNWSAMRSVGERSGLNLAS